MRRMQAAAGVPPPCNPAHTKWLRTSFLPAVVNVARWTVRQEEIIREYGHLGVDAVRKQIIKECGADHSTHAIEMHAHRIHASLRIKPICPECGVIGLPLNLRTGLCPRCSDFQHVQTEITYNEMLAQERIEVSEGDLREEAKRDYDALRQRNARLKRKYGLASKRPKYGK